MAGEEVIFSGELIKAPPLKPGGAMSSLKRWTKRHFILRKDAMEYYADPSAQKLLGVIHLPSVTSLVMKCDHPQGKKYEHMFSMLCKDRQYLLAADTDDQRVAWVSKIQSCLTPASAEVGKTGDYMNFENVRQYQEERETHPQGDGPDLGARTEAAGGAAAEGADGEHATSLGKATVQFDFVPGPENAKRIELKAGDVVEVLDDLSLWWVVRREDGVEGLAPSNYLAKID
eukprot:CAMPEP_0182922322 /NCGR_PEP_ID=MMETSP0105_2-20130417/4723_1 /TAXON_ID=81532 ORGANISM="Acanthoeca-like sp., Strain 10tr" /NCGR_SAMPLE_ID=MMETSP0105_2 /ASSEMBLY_ACC=CAM_ASM_000205 /LENGTH=229 /DNA_ID=CAMNT_0025059929 /DNA_START=20 /DNA_END=709 /DNA_ORIENTATION=-